MPWCPKCKTEYRDGIEKCSDCGSVLVESLKESSDTVDKSKMLNFLYGPKEHVDTLCKVLQKEGRMKAQSVYNEKKDCYELYILPEDQERAIQLVNRFMEQVNAANMNKADSEQKQELKQRVPDNRQYRSTKERAADHKSSAVILLIIGFIGLIVIALLATGIITGRPVSSIGSIVAYSVMGAFFLIFVIMGFSSVKSYKQLSKISDNEDDITGKLDEFCKKNLTAEIINSKTAPFIQEESQEYFYRAEYMRQTILNEFPDISVNFLEEYVDDKYGEIFE